MTPKTSDATYAPRHSCGREIAYDTVGACTRERLLTIAKAAEINSPGAICEGSTGRQNLSVRLYTGERYARRWDMQTW